MQYPLCRHIHTSGTRCGSPALANGNYCFFHRKLMDRHQQYRRIPGYAMAYESGALLELAPLEDRASVQMALSLVINALAARNLDPKRATALLYGLQLASMNLPRGGSLSPEPAQVVWETFPTPEGPELARPGALTEDLPGEVGAIEPPGREAEHKPSAPPSPIELNPR